MIREALIEHRKRVRLERAAQGFFVQPVAPVEEQRCRRRQLQGHAHGPYGQGGLGGNGRTGGSCSCGSSGYGSQGPGNGLQVLIFFGPGG